MNSIRCRYQGKQSTEKFNLEELKEMDTRNKFREKLNERLDGNHGQ